MIYPYYMEVKTAANMMALQFAHDGYADKGLSDSLRSDFESEKGILGQLTMGANAKVSAAKDQYILPSFTSRAPLLIATYMTDVTGANLGIMKQLDSTQALALITTAVTSGTPPKQDEISNRDKQFTVIIRTNFRLQTVIMGRTYVAHLPITVTTSGITIKQYRW
jgi:hypothetical protein